MTVASVPETLRHRHLVSPSLWPRVSGRISAEEDVGPAEADAILDATVGFLLLCATHPDARLAPSAPVDAGWHAFLMYTRGYRELCLALAGRMIDHEPTDGPGDGPAPTAYDTVRFMREHNVPFDAALWPVHASAPCGPCTPSPSDDTPCTNT